MASLQPSFSCFVAIATVLALGTVHASAGHRGGANPPAAFMKMNLTDANFQGHDYSSGVWQFEGYGIVPSGTLGVLVMQIHNEGDAHAMILMLHVYDGLLRFYDGQAVKGGIYDRWFRLNVVHDADASTVAVYVDGKRRLTAGVIPSRSYYFKFGVYMQHCEWSSCMESRWRNITIYTKA